MIDQQGEKREGLPLHEGTREMGRKQKGGTTSPCRPLLCFRVCTHTPLDRVDLRQGGLHPHTQPPSGPGPTGGTLSAPVTLFYSCLVAEA